VVTASPLNSSNASSIPVRASASYVFYLHGDFASMWYVVTSLAFLFCLLHVQRFFLRYACGLNVFLRYACELNGFCLPALERARFLPHPRSTFFCLRWSARFLPHARSAFFCLRYIACLCSSMLERARSTKPSVSRVIFPGRAGQVIWFF
jgi:hypothetical protein